VFHLFGLAKFAGGGLILSSIKPVFDTAPAALKNETSL
jgi:hypothetical protein